VVGKPKYTLKEINFENVEADLSSKQAVEAAAIRFDNKAKVYQAWLGYYKNHSRAMGWNDERLVAEGNHFAVKGLISGDVPGLQKSTVGKMGLKGVKGLNIVPNEPKVLQNRGGGGEGRSTGSGGRGRGGGGSGGDRPPGNGGSGGGSSRSGGGGAGRGGRHGGVGRGGANNSAW